MSTPAQLTQNFVSIQTAIEAACKRSGRKASDVTLMAVTKYATDADVLALLSTGLVQHIGESRVQQALARWTKPDFAKYSVIKHFIGHLQKNKAALAAQFFDFIDSIDDIETAKLLSSHAEKHGKILHVLVQIKLTDRSSQSGLALADAPALVAALHNLPNIIPCGYMAIAPQTDNVAQLRALFMQVHAAFERDFPVGQERYLSLGMSNDFEVAVEAGSTLPRIGSNLFATHLEE